MKITVKDLNHILDNTFYITAYFPIACEEGLRFAIREGGRTVGSGVVIKILAD